MNVKALHSVSYGLYVVTSKKDEKRNGQIANTVFQVASQPVTIAVSINKQNLTHEYIGESEVFAVSILSKDTPLPFIGRFGFRSGREIDKLEGVNFKMGKTGAPIVLDNALAWLEAKVVGKLDVGSHTLFTAEVVDADVLADGEPMTYAYYHLVKRGSTPKTAPVHVEG
jgi:ferric-chelate reductase [NAD(P)H]